MHGSNQRRAIHQQGVTGLECAPVGDQQRQGNARGQPDHRDSGPAANGVLALLTPGLSRSGFLAVTIQLPGRHGVAQHRAGQQPVHALPKDQLADPAPIEVAHGRGGPVRCRARRARRGHQEGRDEKADRSGPTESWWLSRRRVGARRDGLSFRARPIGKPEPGHAWKRTPPAKRRVTRSAPNRIERIVW